MKTFFFILHLILKTYGAECWALKMEDERRLKTTEMRMLRMICGKTLKDKMNNEKIREMTGVVSRVSNRTVNPNEPFHFGEPEPNLNQQNFTSMNLNQT